MKPIDKEVFREQIIQGMTLEQLKNYYECSRSTIAEYKKMFGFVGLSPNSKKLNRESGDKYCPICKTTKSLVEFYSNGRNASGTVKYKPSCISCENDSRKEKLISLILRYLESTGQEYKCSVCGITNMYGFLDFHHAVPEVKEFEIGSKTSTYSIDRFNQEIVPELEKCVLLCPNCHRLEHLLMGST